MGSLLATCFGAWLSRGVGLGSLAVAVLAFGLLLTLSAVRVVAGLERCLGFGSGPVGRLPLLLDGAARLSRCKFKKHLSKQVCKFAATEKITSQHSLHI